MTAIIFLRKRAGKYLGDYAIIRSMGRILGPVVGGAIYRDM